MKTSKRTRLLTKIIVKTNRAQHKVQEDFFMKVLQLPVSRLEKIAKNVKVRNQGREIIVEK